MLTLETLPEGTRLRLTRVAAGLTLFEVGRLANVSPPRLSEFERGRGKLAPGALQRVRAVLTATCGEAGQGGEDAA